MIPVQFPPHEFKMKEQDGREMIFDTFRKQWVVLTPEEWVRQNFLQWLVQVLQYPASLISIEREIMLGDLRKRFDIAVYNRSGKPWLLVECKGMDVRLDETVLHQVMRYNQALEVSYLVITNGSFTRGFQLVPGFIELDVLPDHL
ncbi:MAG: type I restriction enzyme HsdR N-terminal domain-containing protein [Chitinophagaceae bacterium]